MVDHTEVDLYTGELDLFHAIVLEVAEQMAAVENVIFANGIKSGDIVVMCISSSVLATCSTYTISTRTLKLTYMVAMSIYCDCHQEMLDISRPMLEESTKRNDILREISASLKFTAGKTYLDSFLDQTNF
ncbi:hypothetical protein DPMN_113264 [Dreissena polymorpha]|uniref:Uncharacterized protein n=1 Tax=Dreissena polymorpha TaxID=45954 RepID=A0A9D4KH63_DREPO|nr:hypothetical protein DPMN_113264 [Dreissena polymorpha]